MEIPGGGGGGGLKFQKNWKETMNFQRGWGVLEEGSFQLAQFYDNLDYYSKPLSQ